MQSVLLGKQSGQRCDIRVLIGKATRIGVTVGAIAAQLGPSESTHQRRRQRGASRFGTEQAIGRIAQQRIVTKNDNAVARQMHICFEATDADIESGLERRQRIFRMKSTSAAMAL